MRFETALSVPGDPAFVIERFADVPAMAACLPGASVGPVNADGSYPATLVVSFGPKRIAFKGTLTNRVDHENRTGVLAGRASADLRAAKMAVQMTYALAAERGPDSAGTRITLVSEAELTGVLAEFANTGGVVLANALLGQFARNFAAQYAGRETSSAGTPARVLSGWRLIGALFQAFLQRLKSLFQRGTPG